jgi:5-methylcytosine-specific restriction endonuclease McrA
VQRQGDSQNWLCWWRGPNCLVDCRETYHVDHLIPLARGGHNNPSNIVITCPFCNQSKKDKTPYEWIGRLL